MPRERNTFTDKLAEKLKVGKRRAEQLQKEGATLEGADRSQAEKLRKLILDNAILEEKLARLKRDVIPRTEALQKGIELAGIFNRLCSEAMTNWPTELGGKNEIEVRQIIAPFLGEFTKEFLAAAEAL